MYTLPQGCTELPPIQPFSEPHFFPQNIFVSKNTYIPSTTMLQPTVLLLAFAAQGRAFNVPVGNPGSSLRNSKVPFRQQAVAIPLDGTMEFLQQKAKGKKIMDPADAWVANLDYEGFSNEVAQLGKELIKDTGNEDVDHLNKIVEWRNIAALVGLSTVWIPTNPVTVIALSTWIYSSWTMIAHHTCHGGYNRVDAGRYNSRKFALGPINRVIDWLDWMAPEAWNVEHNRLHHYRLNEGKDPDLVQRNVEWIRSMDVPLVAKYAIVAFFMPLWKWYYYAPNTYKEMKINEWQKTGKDLPNDVDIEEALTVVSFFDKSRSSLFEIVPAQEFFTTVLAPMFIGRYVVVNAVGNLLLAELLTNVHAFATIVTNHAGEDLYTFDDAVKPKTGSFYVRQIVGSANYDAGSDVNDFAHGWLNYQIEHHVWPDLSMLQYQRGAPKLKAICEKYGVPYVQENVFERLRKTVDVMVGRTTMRRFPTEYEPAWDKAGVAGVTWKSTNGAIDE
jgi:fatty acid desaturase